MRPSIAVAVLALGGLQLWYVRAGDTACHAFDADTRSIEWSLVRNKEQQVSCLYQLANARQKDDLKKWLEAEGFVVKKLKMAKKNDGGSLVSAAWESHKKGNILPFTSSTAYSEVLTFRYGEGREIPSVYAHVNHW